MDGIFTNTDVMDRSSMVAEESEINIEETKTDRIGEQAETLESEEKMGVATESMGIHPTSHTHTTESGVEKTQTPMEVGWCERGFLGEGIY